MLGRQTVGERGRQLAERRGGRDRRHTHEVGVSRNEVRLVGLDDRAELAAQAVPGHGIARPTTDGIGDLRGLLIRAFQSPNPDGTIAARPNSSQLGERRTAADSVDQAEIRARPRARRDLSTARPARFFIRRRKPCFFLRFRLFGWKVRFTHGLLSEGKIAPRSPSEEGLEHVGEGAEKGELRVARTSLATRSTNGREKSPDPDRDPVADRTATRLAVRTCRNGP